MKKYFLTFIGFLFIGLMYLIGNTYALDASKDSEVLAILIVANENEILAANEALKKTKSNTIKQYALMLKSQHLDYLQEILSIKKITGIKPEDSDRVISLQRSGKKLIEDLSELNDKKFDTAYIDAMAQNHIQLAHLIDEQLLKNAENPSVKNLLIATRPHIGSYLKRIEIIQKSFN